MRGPRPRRRLAAALLVPLLAACTAEPGALSPREHAALDRQLQRLAAARESGHDEAIAIYAAEIIDRFPRSADAADLREAWPSLSAAAERARARAQRAAKWTYHAAEHIRGTQLLAEIAGEADPAAPPLRLVLRRHPRMGEDAYLLIDGDADFACELRCAVAISFDGASQAVAVRRALDNRPPALFMRDAAAFFAAVEAGDTLHVELPLADGRTAAWQFDIGVYAPARMQGRGK